ncbi:diguanylate cyclase [Shewanella olleyana]|uniref:GGDEF domain-containing protein n=1 Tax=Shewanella olleyana TaxID=135626 RepID=UPI00200EBB1F|nr:GGDEF domain-containing protein [Shewanella olleyana]MCL1067588.1 diguanylate cyclase [Shewanella olleyana]
MVNLINVSFVILALLFSSALMAETNFDLTLDSLEQSFHKDISASEEIIKDLLSEQDQLSQSQTARLYMLISVKSLYLGEFEHALDSLNKALYFKTDDQIKTQITLYKITASIGLKDYQSAFELLEENLARIKRYDDDNIKVDSYIRLMNVYMELEAFDEMLSTATEILRLNKAENTKNECYAKLYLSVANLKLGKLELAGHQFKESETYCKTHNYPLIEAMSIKGQSHVMFEKGEYEASLPGYIDSLERYQAFKFQVEINDNHSYISEVYFHLGDYQQATFYAELVNALPNVPMNYKPKERAYNVLSMVASKRGQFKEAYQYQVQANAIGMQLIDAKKVKENAYQMVKFDSAEKTRELNQLVQDHEMIAKQRSILNNEKSASFMFSTVLVGTVVFLSLMLYAAWMQRNQFRKQAQVDALTGLYNRGAGLEKAENEFVQVQAREATISIILIDLDWFKKINDSFGHATGDWALKKISGTIQEHVKSSDIVCRLGGEEFAIFMPQTNIETAYQLAKTLCAAFANINTRYSGHQFTITGSFGVSELTQDDLSLDPILNRADDALYQAKSAGRNRVVKS